MVYIRKYVMQIQLCRYLCFWILKYFCNIWCILINTIHIWIFSVESLFFLLNLIFLVFFIDFYGFFGFSQVGEKLKGKSMTKPWRLLVVSYLKLGVIPRIKIEFTCFRKTAPFGRLAATAAYGGVALEMGN